MSTLQITHTGAVARITLNRPEVRNAFNDEVIAELSQAFIQLGDDPQVRAIVAALGPGTSGCVAAQRLSRNQVAALQYHGKLQLLPADSHHTCDWLIAPADTPAPHHSARWQEQQRIARPTDAKDVLVLYRRRPT